MNAVQEAIVRAAQEEGIDPNFALATAERESRFDPNAHSSKTIHGLFQMSGPLRAQYGVGDSNDPYTQAKGWARFFKRNKAEMSYVAGRDVTDEEGYLGHHFGSRRAARALVGDPNTPVDQVFTTNERTLNPHFDEAGTMGALNSSIVANMSQRRQKFAGTALDLSGEGTPVETGSGTGRSQSAPDLSSFGTLANLEQPPTGAEPNPAIEERKFEAPSSGLDKINMSPSTTKAAPDFSSYGTPAENPMVVKNPVQMGIRG